MEKTISRLNPLKIGEPGELLEPMEIGIKSSDPKDSSNALNRQEISANQFDYVGRHIELIPGDFVAVFWNKPDSKNIHKELGVFMGGQKVAVTHRAIVESFTSNTAEIYTKRQQIEVVDLSKREVDPQMQQIQLKVRGQDRL